MQTQLKEQQTIPLTRDDFIIMQLREIREDIRDLRGEIKDVRNEMKETKRELNARMDKLEDTLNARMGKVENEVRSAMRHSQIMAGSVVAIALGVLYFLFTH